MPDERWQKVQSLFADALLRAVGERVAFLDRACGNDPVLRQDVASLLEHDTMAPGGFLEPPKPTQPCPLIEPDSLIGTLIGQYEIKRLIGSGGMGTVYEAEQQRPKRLVALKLVKADLPSRSLPRRLEYESEVLARLQHPHIAQIFEAGTHRDAAGQTWPYFAMEFVPEAKPITTFAANFNLGTRERLALFAQACEAVHYGHQKGVIHRDLKPANILVNSERQVKVIDFGVARATDSDVAVTTMHTDVGSLIGTLQYMSPEQCEADPLGLDVRSDVYSLGVVLFELLTGMLPYCVAGRPIPSATRVICESQPTRPSIIDRKLRGDLEIIVLTALEKDRSKRYQSAGGLAADIQRYLRRDPISAKPRSRWTKAVHWAGRHPRVATAIASMVIALGIIGGTTLATRYLNREPRQVRIADDRSAAYLVSVADRRLHRWHSLRDGLRAVEDLIEPPASAGMGRLAIIGYTCADTGVRRNSICAYDIDANRDEPLWAGAIATDDLPPILTQRTMTGGEFFPDLVRALDVFPQVEGVEIVVVHKHESRTSSALRVYNFRGQVLYQVWLDVHVKALYWLSSSGQIVLAGTNGRAFWSERGHHNIKTPHPKVVFAVRPELNFRSNQYVVEEPGNGPLEPVWYRCIGKPEACDLIREVNFLDPLETAHFGRYFRLNLTIGKNEGSTYDVLVNWQGEEDRDSRRLSDALAREWDQLPSPDFFALQELPPATMDIPYGSAPDAVRSNPKSTNKGQ